jgi:hypothetical protein
MSAAQVNAMKVDWQTGTNTAVTLADGMTGVPQGSLVELGVFKNGLSDTAIAALGVNPTAIQNAFSVWASDTIGDNTDAEGAFGMASDSPGTGFFSLSAFLVVFNNLNPSLATQVGVMKGPWVFPASNGAPMATFTVDDVTASMVLIGGYAPGAYSDSTLNGGTGWFGDGANSVELAIPEPSTYALVSMGLLGALGLHRRRR